MLGSMEQLSSRRSEPLKDLTLARGLARLLKAREAKGAIRMAMAIIPARGGSKRIPRKNLRAFCGRPALQWPIRAALSAGIFDRIVVSTDDLEIADVARAAGAEVPFLRDPILANDMTGTTEVVRDAVNRLDPIAETPVCCIYATAFFVRAEDLREGLSRLDDNTWVLSLGAYATPIDRAYRRDGDRFVPRTPAMMPKRSQDLAPAYFDAGQFYWARAATWRDGTACVYDGAAGVILPQERAVDIDTEEDWYRAERLVEFFGLAP